ncbi:MAG: helix-turn-helix transcriptional regulator [Syntrophomonas sp.]
MEEEYITITPDDFPKKLKVLRQEKGLTQKLLAERANVSQQTVSAIEQGKMDPSLKILITIAGILGVVLLIKAFSKKEDT